MPPRQRRSAPGARAPARPDIAHDLGQLIGHARRMVWMACSRSLEERGRSIHAWQILARLEKAGSMTQFELASATAQHPAGTSRLLKELQADGLVTRTRDPGDHRRMLVGASPKGRRLFIENRPAVHAAIAGVFGVLSSTEQERLRVLLAKVSAQRP